jgi:omega-6 fatty acid desaturase (delta-12 desaturase)
VAIPYTVLATTGTWLFYVQHNFPGARWCTDAEWSRPRAAHEGSSYMAMPAALHWITGHIGYHHIHHLDARIPAWRLPEAFAAVPELQRPADTSWHPRHVRAALALAVQDGDHMITWEALR